MHKRKLELALVIIAVALVGFLVRGLQTNSRETAQPAPRSVDFKMPKAKLSDDAKWLIKTSADSYSPRVKVEKAWSENDQTQAEAKAHTESGMALPAGQP